MTANRGSFFSVEGILSWFITPSELLDQLTENSLEGFILISNATMAIIMLSKTE